jgi:hypothetical protein
MMAITDPINDLRYAIFQYVMNGQLMMFYYYNGQCGVNVGEVHLIKAEAALRKTSSDPADAIATLNHLRAYRFTPAGYATEEVPANISNDDLLDEILIERRREVRLNEQSFFDRKRLNLDPNRAAPMSRVHLEVEYTLPLGDPRWQFVIPQDVMSFHPNWNNNR